MKKGWTNKHKVADIFVKAVTNDDYTRGDADYSVSDLVRPPRIVHLTRRHADKIVKDVSDMFHIFRGHGLHRELERHVDPNCLSEERFFLTLEENGVRRKVSGKPDIYDGNTLAIEDLKSTSVWAFIHSNKPEWEDQLNCYRALLEHNGFPVKKLTIHAALYDWNRNEAMRNSDYPQTPFHSVDIPMWPIEQTNSLIEANVKTLTDNEEVSDNELPACSTHDMWETPTTWAVIKQGNKKASRGGVCASFEEAETFIKGHKDEAKLEIHERKGERKRCISYCDAAPFCNIFEEYAEGA